ncbi:MAG: hypothetical protein OXR84_12125 [Magnetovibrio sp.]|nr:hypothetical protein [Magnetovibrio sp.]
MSHHRFEDRPTVTLEQIDAGIRRAHELRSQSFTGFFKNALDRRYRALNVAGKGG